MNNKLQNIISNTLGILIIIVSVYFNLTTDLTLETFGGSLLVGASLFFFKVSESKKWLSKIFQYKLKGDN